MITIQEVLNWKPSGDDFVINLFQWRDYVILVTYSGRIWRAERGHNNIIDFTLISHLI